MIFRSFSLLGLIPILIAACDLSASASYGDETQPIESTNPSPANDPQNTHITLKEIKEIAKSKLCTLFASLRSADKKPEHDGAIFNPPDFRVPPSSPPLSKIADSTAAFFWAEQLAFARDQGWPTMESVADQKCGDSCGANIKGIREELGNLPTGAIAAGVVVSEHVVAANRHVTNNLQYDIDNARVVFGFQAEPVNGRLPSQLQIHSITRICHSRDANTDLALVQLDGVSLSSLVQAVDFDDQAIEHPTPVVAFGHPWGSSRLMTGHNEHTKIQRCDTGEPEKPGETHATLDSLARSSGSPVYIPKTSKPSEAEEWSLFGIIYGNGENKIVCLDNQYDVIDIDPPPTPCNRGNGTGPLIIPLHPIKQAIETFSNGGKPRGWACHPKDTDNESLAPLGTDTSTNTN